MGLNGTPSQVHMAERKFLGQTTAPEIEISAAAPCIHHLIEQQAAETPDAIAVICRNKQLTYSELNARANQVASYLSKLGAGPDKLVGICLERSLEMMTGLLGI